MESERPMRSPQSGTRSRDEQSVPWRKYFLAARKRKYIYVNPLILAPALLAYASPFVLSALTNGSASDSVMEFGRNLYVLATIAVLILFIGFAVASCQFGIGLLRLVQRRSTWIHHCASSGIVAGYCAILMVMTSFGWIITN